MDQDDGFRRILDSISGDAEEYFQKAQLFQERTAEIVGTATSANGHVKVIWRGDALHELEINPRAMRMGSAELAETILRLSREAKADSREQADTLMRELFGDRNPAGIVRDRQGLQESIEMMRDAFTGAIGDSRDLVDQLQRRLRQP